MKGVKYLILFCFCLAGFNVSAQPYKSGERVKPGMKGGLTLTSMGGTELSDPRPKAGFTIGLYSRIQLGPSLHLLPEINATFRGSNFKATKDEQYNQIHLIYLDFPVCLMVDLKDKSNQHLVFFGPQLSVLLNANVYVRPDIAPKYRDSQAGIKPVDLMGVVGYQYNAYYFGFQVALKYSALDLNNNLFYPDVLQPTGGGGSVRNMALELSFLF